jgi:hypothetical protein
LVPTLQSAAEAAGLDWSKLQLTDNSCPAKPPTKGPLEELESDIEKAERFAEGRIEALEEALAPELTSFGRGFTILEKKVEDLETRVIKELSADEAAVEAELRTEADAAARMIRRFAAEAKMGRWIQVLPLNLREIIMPMP